MHNYKFSELTDLKVIKVGDTIDIDGFFKNREHEMSYFEDLTVRALELDATLLRITQKNCYPEIAFLKRELRGKEISEIFVDEAAEFDFDRYIETTHRKMLNQGLSR